MEFMTLPVEIRQLVIGIVVTSPSDPPETPSASQHDRHNMRMFYFNVGIWRQPPKNPALNMMLVNHKLHDEVKFYLPLAPGKYHVDIMSVKTYGLWPTWSISKMPTTQYIETVSCTFRLFEPTPDLDTRFARAVNCQGDYGSSPESVGPFYALLEDLFCLGPGYCRGNRSWSSFVVGTIVVDFLAPTDGAAHSSVIRPEAEFQQSQASRPPFLRQEGHRPEGMTPEEIFAQLPAMRPPFLRQEGYRPEGMTPEETFAQLLARYIKVLFRLDYRAVRYGRVLYECLLDRLVLLVNGKEHKIFDVKEMYKTYEPGWGSSTTPIRGSEEFYEKWKIWVSERRAKIRAGQEVKYDGRTSWTPR